MHISNTLHGNMQISTNIFPPSYSTSTFSMFRGGQQIDATNDALNRHNKRTWPPRNIKNVDVEEEPGKMVREYAYIDTWSCSYAYFHDHISIVLFDVYIFNVSWSPTNRRNKWHIKKTQQIDTTSNVMGIVRCGTAKAQDWCPCFHIYVSSQDELAKRHNCANKDINLAPWRFQIVQIDTTNRHIK